VAMPHTPLTRITVSCIEPPVLLLSHPVLGMSPRFFRVDYVRTDSIDTVELHCSCPRGLECFEGLVPRQEWDKLWNLGEPDCLKRIGVAHITNLERGILALRYDDQRRPSKSRQGMAQVSSERIAMSA
jgi:hypothetical protein